MLLITDNFAWMDITEQVSNDYGFLLNAWNFKNLYAVETSDNSDFEIGDVDDVERHISNGLRICIEVGYLPQKES